MELSTIETVFCNIFAPFQYLIFGLGIVSIIGIILYLKKKHDDAKK